VSSVLASSFHFALNSGEPGFRPAKSSAYLLSLTNAATVPPTMIVPSLVLTCEVI
jgi:hypothetical protein